MVNRTYKYYEGTPLYPFGYGLSYADFRYDKLKITRSEKGLNIATTLSNKSDVSAQEVVQVYLGMPDAPIRTPQRELVAFKRVNLAGGESQSVKFTINESQLVYVDEQGQRQPYKGKLLVTLGGGQGVKRSDNVVQHSINLP